MMKSFDEMQTYVCVGYGSFCKDYCPQEALSKWLEYTKFKGVNPVIVGVDADYEDVSVGGMGQVIFPEGTQVIEKQIKFGEKELERLEWMRSEYDNCLVDITERAWK